MLDKVVNIKISDPDRKKGLVLPKEISKDLAYLCGVIVGDGHISHRKTSKDYYFFVGGNPKDERGFYDNIIKPLFRKVFGLNVHPKLQSNKSTYCIEFCSKAFVRFLSEIIRIPLGKKSGEVQIPGIFRNSEQLISNFIQGYADTDFCLTLKKRSKKVPYYPVIAGSSKSKKIILQVTNYLKDKGVSVSTQIGKKVYDKRHGKIYQKNSLYLYGNRSLKRWMDLIGFRNPKQLKRFDLWEKRNKNK